MKTRLGVFALLLSLFAISGVSAQTAQASIKFERTTINLGTFSEKDPVRKCVFTYTNKGDLPLVIDRAVASCGCTVPKYTKEPVKPGETGQINVTYNGKGKFPGHFKKTITVRTNGDPSVTRLYIEGEMTEAETAGKSDK
ncbi:MAG: DUF1573 domain-containing protein [Prevotella sp.]|nr:DUF1573 domain-containing protein [Prevotella sp.]